MENQVEQSFSDEERTWAAFCHLAALLIFVLPYIGGILGPMIVWLVKRERHPLVNDQGKEALNFQITLIISVAVIVLLALAMAYSEVLIAIRMRTDPPLFLLIIWVAAAAIIGIFAILDVVLIIIASLKAKAGHPYRYPVAIRLIK